MEERAYGPDSTDRERDLMRRQIFMYAPGIMKFTEAPVLSEFQLGVFQERLWELADPLDRFRLLIDLSRTIVRPDAPTRAKLKQTFVRISPKVDRCAVFTGRHFILNMAAKFILGGLGFKTLTVSKTIDQALEALEYDGD